MKQTTSGGAINPTLRFAEVTVDGKKYKLAFSFNAIAKAELECGVNLLSGCLTFDNISANQFRGLVYAALSVANPKITPDDAGALITPHNMGAWTTGLIDAYGYSTPKEKNPTGADAAAES